MKTQNNAIRILTITAIILAAAVFFIPRSAPAEVTIKDGDYLACTYPVQGGSDGLYIVDTRTGVLAVFVYDNSTKTVMPKAMRRIEDGFMIRGQ